MLTALDPTGVSSMVMSFTKYGACGGENFLVSSRELDYGMIGNNKMVQSFILTAQEPVTVTRIATPAFSSCFITPESDCVGKQLLRGQSCKVSVAVSTGAAALDAEVRIYTDAYSTIPYPVHVLANTEAAATCRELPNVEEAANLTSVAGVWAFNNNQAQKMVVQSTGTQPRLGSVVRLCCLNIQAGCWRARSIAAAISGSGIPLRLSASRISVSLMSSLVQLTTP
jgi:hypothetical protein